MMLSKDNIATGIGLLRDLLAVILSVAILFGADFTNDQVAGILLLVTTLGAFGSWAYTIWKSRQEEDNEINERMVKRLDN